MSVLFVYVASIYINFRVLLCQVFNYLTNIELCAKVSRSICFVFTYCYSHLLMKDACSFLKKCILIQHRVYLLGSVCLLCVLCRCTFSVNAKFVYYAVDGGTNSTMTDTSQNIMSFFFFK